MKWRKQSHEWVTGAWFEPSFVFPAKLEGFWYQVLFNITAPKKLDALLILTLEIRRMFLKVLGNGSPPSTLLLSWKEPWGNSDSEVLGLTSWRSYSSQSDFVNDSGCLILLLNRTHYVNLTISCPTYSIHQ